MDNYKLVICPICSRQSLILSSKRLVRCSYIYCNYKFDNPHNICVKNNVSLFSIYSGIPIKKDKKL